NHNHLLGAVEGVDGIKTGYTRTSGFNLITSVHRAGRYIIAVILGGKSSSERHNHMRKLIAAYTQQARVHIDPAIQHLALTEERHEIADPIQALIVKTLAAAAEERETMLSGDTPIRSSDFSTPNAQVATRWPLASEIFAPFALPHGPSRSQ